MSFGDNVIYFLGILGLIFTLLVPFIKSHFGGGRNKQIGDLSGKIIVITGGS